MIQLITIPAAGFVGAMMSLTTRAPGGVTIAISLFVVIVGSIYVKRYWKWESFAQVRARLSFLGNLIILVQTTSNANF